MKMFIFILHQLSLADVKESRDSLLYNHFSKHIGKEFNFEYFVFSNSFNSFDGYVELNYYQTWNHSNNFMVRLSPELQKKYNEIGVDDPADFFLARKIQITGLVEIMEYTDGTKIPAIFPSYLDQIKIIKPQEYEYEADDYKSFKWNDFKIKVSPVILKNIPEKGMKMVNLLKKKLSDIKQVLPVASFESISKTTFWINQNAMKEGLCYHNSLGYLKKVDMPLYYDKSIEIQHLEKAYDWIMGTRPWIILHELAHKYHYEILGKNEPLIIESFYHAIQTGNYKKVKHVDGKEKIAYAITNHAEYFAECTVSYFGLNDYFPFNREEFRVHDPKGYEMIEKLWGVNLHN